MSYQLRRNQTLGANLRRICQKQVEDALEMRRRILLAVACEPPRRHQHPVFITEGDVKGRA
jgi:hypothetical protein